MRIALVTETWPPEVNGVAFTVQSLANGLQALGHAVQVVRPRQSDEAPANVMAIDHVLVRGATMPRYRSLRFGLPNPGEMCRLWRQAPPDAVYVATEGPLGRSAVLAATKLGVPVCTGFHTRFDDFVRHYGGSALSPLVFAWMRRFHNSADATLVPTTELAEFLRGRGFRNVQLLRRAVATRQFDPRLRDHALRASWGVPGNELAVIHVGRIAAEKNLDLATRAFRAIQRRRPDARFIIIGDGPVRAEWAKANPDFHFCGVRRDLDLGRHYASGDLFLFPSLSETFGNVTLEAMASGLATVAFDYGAAREHIHHGIDGLRVDRDDDSGFIASAVSLAGNDALRMDLGLRARQAVQALDPAHVAANFAHLLADLGRSRAA